MGIVRNRQESQDPTIHRYASALGSVRLRSLPIFHALTGSDTTSFFARHGKKTAWNTWETYPEVTRVFIELASGPSSITDETLATIERFIAPNQHIRQTLDIRH